MNFLDHAIQCDVFPTRHPSQNVNRFNKVFRFWHSIWSATFLELKGQEKVFSDDFDRHDEIISLTLHNEVIGAVLVNWYDLDIDSHLQHSYFSVYPKEAIDKIRGQGGKFVMTIGNLSVHPSWRRTHKEGLQFDLSGVLMGLASKRFLSSPADHWIAFTRNNRKVNELCYSHGASCIMADLKAHNVSVDIVATSRQSAIINQDPGAEELVHRLWERRQLNGASEIPHYPETSKAA